MDDLLDKAIDHLAHNRKGRAMDCLISILRQDRSRKAAWFLLHSCVSKPNQKEYCQEQIKLLTQLIDLQVDIDKEKFNNKSTNFFSSKLDQKNSPFLFSDNKRVNYPIGNEEIENLDRIILKDHFDERIYQSSSKEISKFYSFLINEKSYLPDPDSGIFGNTFIINGIFISPFDCPICLEDHNEVNVSDCDSCDFFHYSDCPFINDPEIYDEVLFFFKQVRYSQNNYYTKRQSVVDIIYKELKQHGRPLHYEVIGKILSDRHPEYKLSPNQILHYMIHNIEKFENVYPGVYRAI